MTPLTVPLLSLSEVIKGMDPTMAKEKEIKQKREIEEEQERETEFLKKLDQELVKEREIEEKKHSEGKTDKLLQAAKDEEKKGEWREWNPGELWSFVGRKNARDEEAKKLAGKTPEEIAAIEAQRDKYAADRIEEYLKDKREAKLRSWKTQLAEEKVQKAREEAKALEGVKVPLTWKQTYASCCFQHNPVFASWAVIGPPKR